MRAWLDSLDPKKNEAVVHVIDASLYDTQPNMQHCIYYKVSHFDE